MEKSKNISMALIKRLPKYYRYLGELMRNEVDRISSKELGEKIGFTASQIRQDLNCFGDFGQQGYGYNVTELYNQIKSILGLDRGYKAALVGAGNIGQAVSNYSRFEDLGFKRASQQTELFTADNKLGNLAIEVGKEVIPKMDGDVLFYFTYAPQGDKAALDTAKEWTNDPLWKNLNAVKSGNVHEVSDAIWNTAGGVLAANIMLDEIEEIFNK